MLPWICSVKDHRWRQIWIRTRRWHLIRSRLCHWKESPLYFYVKRDLAIFYLVNRDLIFPHLWIVIKDIKIFLCPRELIFWLKCDSWMENWIKCDPWTILFCVMNSRLFNELKRIVLERLWLSFDQGFDRTWTSFRSIKVINKIANGPRTNKIRHHVITCRIRLVKTRNGKN